MKIVTAALLSFSLLLATSAPSLAKGPAPRVTTQLPRPVPHLQASAVTNQITIRHLRLKGGNFSPVTSPTNY
jgi:hypothetical protein